MPCNCGCGHLATNWSVLSAAGIFCNVFEILIYLIFFLFVSSFNMSLSFYVLHIDSACGVPRCMILKPPSTSCSQSHFPYNTHQLLSNQMLSVRFFIRIPHFYSELFSLHLFQDCCPRAGLEYVSHFLAEISRLGFTIIIQKEFTFSPQEWADFYTDPTGK